MKISGFITILEDGLAVAKEGLGDLDDFEKAAPVIEQLAQEVQAGTPVSATPEQLQLLIKVGQDLQKIVASTKSAVAGG